MKKLMLVLVATALMVGCKKNAIIPEKDMVTIVTKIFLSDALTLTAPNDISLFNRDSIDYYAHIYTSMGYTSAQFDSSIVFYTKNPALFDQIIDKAIADLSKLETELNAKLNAVKTDSLQNLWVGKDKWIFPTDSKSDTIGFRIPSRKPGKYTLSVCLRVLPNDESVEPKVIFAFNLNNDSTYFNKRIENLSKDGITRTIKIENSISDTSITHLTGAILHHEPQTGKWTKHAEVFSINISFEPIIDSSKVALNPVPKNRHRLEKQQ